jgi:UDP-2,3-diacylglucosamine pyrophosphatase LpxH
MAEGKRLTRRDFIKAAAAGGALLASGCRSIPLFKSATPRPPTKSLRFGVIADVHFNLHPDAQKRLIPFIEEMNRRKVDFIIQLGDFCHGYSPETKAKFDDFMNLWNSFRGPKYHVLGNHDVEKCSKKEVMAYWGMPKNFYSYDMAGYHFVILDSNYLKFDDEYRDYEKGNNQKNPEKGAYLSAAELDWLKRDLAATENPTIVFSHCGLDPRQGVKNAAEARAVLEQANREARFPKVVACFCGHYHKDGHSPIAGIHYVEINSAVYYWLGGKWRWINYKDSLYATVALKPGLIEIEGKKSQLLPPWPAGQSDAPKVDPDVTAQISNRLLRY